MGGAEKRGQPLIQTTPLPCQKPVAWSGCRKKAVSMHRWDGQPVQVSVTFALDFLASNTGLEFRYTMSKTHQLDHPLVSFHLTTLRDKSTSCSEFRASVNRLSMLLAFAATRDLSLAEVPIETPIQKTLGSQLLNRIGLIPILRAGVGMVDSMLTMIPTAEVWHLGLYRDEATATPVRYYSKLPDSSPVDVAFVLDPMLATGGSAAMAIATLQEWGVKTIKMLSIISAPEGIARMEKEFPEVEIHTCAIDSCLNEQKFIVPGLGDAGDRIFNTTG